MNENNSSTEPGSRIFRRFDDLGNLTFGPQTSVEPIAAFSSRIVSKPDRRPKPTGWLFPMPYSLEMERTSHVQGRARKFFSGYQDQYDGNIRQILDGAALNMAPKGNNAKARPYPNIDHVSQAQAKALNGLLTHGNQLDGTFNVGVAWMERKETADLLTTAARQMVQTLSDLRRGQLKKAFNDLFPNGSPKDWAALKDTPYYKWYRQRLRRAAKPLTPKELSGAYLALQNGWKPALADLHNAAEALANRNTLADWVVTGTGYWKTKTVSKDIDFPPGQPKCSWVHEYVSTRAVFCRIDATVTDQHLHKLAQLGLNNPAAILYESSILTYVIDYKLALGDWLQSLGAVDGMSFYSGSTTRYGEYVALLRSESRGSNIRFSGQSRWVKTQRDVLTNFPVAIPPLSLKPKPLNLWQLGNILALATQLLTGGTSDLNG